MEEEYYFYSIPKVFLNRYIYQLSSKAFCTLFRFYRFYLNNYDEGKSISIPFYTFQKEILVNDDHDECEGIWSELDKWDLIKRNYSQGFYELNLTEINKGNFGETGKSEKGRFKVYVKSRGKKIQRKKNDVLLQNYIKKIISRFSNKRISDKLHKLIKGDIEYLLKSKNKIELKDIRKLTDPLLNASDSTIEKVCDIYNNNVNYYGKRSYGYIHGILKNISNQEENKPTKFKYENLEVFKKEKEESDRNTAIKIAKGEVDGNIPYESYIKLGDFENLKKLYKLGVKFLREDNMENEIFRNYEWLKNEG